MISIDFTARKVYFQKKEMKRSVIDKNYFWITYYHYWNKIKIYKKICILKKYMEYYVNIWVHQLLIIKLFRGKKRNIFSAT
eukprot:UN17511